MNRRDHGLTRRALLQNALLTSTAAASAALLSACTTAEPRREPAGSAEREETTTTASSPAAVPGRVLIAYFSRAGENYYYGDRIDLEVGNTEVLANKDQRLSSTATCTASRPPTPTPTATTRRGDRNVREQDENARPGISNLIDLDRPVPDRAPREPDLERATADFMSMFAEGFDFTGKHPPLDTYAVSGLGRTEETYAELLPTATFGEALAIQGEVVAQSDADAEAWLRRIGLLA